MNYKIGDRVRVIDDIRYGLIYNNLLSVEGQEKYRNRIGEVIELEENTEDRKLYRLSVDNGIHIWDTDMLEPITDITTEEFIEEVKKLGYEIRRNFNTIFIDTSFMDKGDKYTELVAEIIIDEAYSVNTTTDAPMTKRLYSLIDCYARTYVNKREPEKVFMLRFPNVDNCNYNYFRVDSSGYWDRCKGGSTSKDSRFTESEIVKLQEEFPEINFNKLERVEITQ